MINLIGHLIMGLLLMEPKLIISPSGSENKSVKLNNLRVPKKPSNKDIVTVVNIFLPLNY